MYDTGSTTFMLVCTMLVFLMTPGLAFFYGGLDQLLCLPVLNQVLQAAEGNAADGAAYPQIINIAFQMAFAMITAAIVTGSLAGRVKFGAMTAFLGI